MATIQSKPCNEATIEEQEFYHLVLNTSLYEEDSGQESLEEFFSEEKAEERLKLRYPVKWRSDFYDPYRKRL